MLSAVRSSLTISPTKRFRKLSGLAELSKMSTLWKRSRRKRSRKQLIMPSTVRLQRMTRTLAL